jgi:pimeloyl-ACP methyl ester carboxylesterase
LGGPADATTFRRIEDDLAHAYTVVTYDPRGISHSSPFDPRDDDRMVELLAADVHRLLAALGGGKASVFANSGGAVIALGLAGCHPEQLGTVVLHEPPSPDLLEDPERVRAANEDIRDTCAREGIFPAMQKFTALIGTEGGPPPAPEGEPSPSSSRAWP